MQLGLAGLRLSTAQQLISTAGVSVSNRNEVLTFLAPSEAAWNTYFAANGYTRQTFFAQASLVRALALYHVVPGVAYSEPFVVGVRRKGVLLTDMGQRSSPRVIHPCPCTRRPT